MLVRLRKQDTEGMVGPASIDDEYQRRASLRNGNVVCQFFLHTITRILDVAPRRFMQVRVLVVSKPFAPPMRPPRIFKATIPLNRVGKAATLVTVVVIVSQAGMKAHGQVDLALQ